MEGSKEVFCRIREEVFNDIPSELRIQFSSVTVKESNEWETHKDDKHYRRLYKVQKEAKKNLQDYLFDKRHNHKHKQ